MNLLYIGLNGINQIASKSIFQIDCTAYNKPYRRFLKKMMGYTGVLDEHHIFPRCLKNHPVLYDIEFNSGKNLKLMPNRRTPKKICSMPYLIQDQNQHQFDNFDNFDNVVSNTNQNTNMNANKNENMNANSNVVLKHESHIAYTHYVKTQLDLIDPYGEDREYQIWLLLGHLEQNLNFERQIPFKSTTRIKYK